MTGTVVTFYSYKGGVGRSFTLSNTAMLLARWGYRVLTIDWDLEAPGLHHYFAPVMSRQPTGGVVDLVQDFLTGAKSPRDHTVEIDAYDGRLSLLAAGDLSDAQPDRVQSINWESLYEAGFASFLETCREEWTAKYDFVLIDSRTGISDIAGICTAHLPDRLVMVFTANEQNLTDIVDTARRADAARDRLPYDRPRHLVLPILSRLDARVEYQRAEEWQRRCAGAVAPLLRTWLPKSVPEELMMRHLTLPYVSYWSFGEQLPVEEEQTPSADQISFALETVASVIAQQFDRIDLLADNRDAYVAAARERQRKFDFDLLVSSPRSVASSVVSLIDELRALDVRVERSLSGDPELLDENTVPAQHLCLVVDGEVTRWQVTEAEQFLRHTLGPEGYQRRQLFCVLTRSSDRDRLPGFLRNLQPLEFVPGQPAALVAQELHNLIFGTQATGISHEHEILRQAEAALRGVSETAPYTGRLELIQQTVRDMASTFHDEDWEQLGDLAVDLNLLGKGRRRDERATVPEDLRAEVSGLLDLLVRRITPSTD